MSIKTKLDHATQRDLATAAETLRDFIDSKRSSFDDMSERWQESDKGQAVSEWLDGLEELCDSLQAVESEAAV